MSSNARLAAYVVAAPGLEPFVADELNLLGAHDVKAHHGGVDCTVTFPQLGLINLHLRTATRVLVRIARFRAVGFRDLEDGLAAIDWPAWITRGSTLSVTASSTASKLFHTGAIEERTTTALAKWNGEGPAQTVYVRVRRDIATVSIDASGEPLHKRGWRQAVDDAPMRETLAAALLISSGWDRRSPLVDPFCGSGTIAIEAASMARRIPPGRHREFAFQTWPRFADMRWDRLLVGADDEMIDRIVPISGSDISQHAIDAAHANAARAGVADRVEFRTCTAAEVTPTEPLGWVVTNPPYGARIKGGTQPWRQLADLLGRVPRWRGAVIAPSRIVDSHLGAAHLAAAADRVGVGNGGIKVQLVPFAGVSGPSSVREPAR